MIVIMRRYICLDSNGANAHSNAHRGQVAWQLPSVEGLEQTDGVCNPGNLGRRTINRRAHEGMLEGEDLFEEGNGWNPGQAPTKKLRELVGLHCTKRLR